MNQQSRWNRGSTGSRGVAIGSWAALVLSGCGSSSGGNDAGATQQTCQLSADVLASADAQSSTAGGSATVPDYLTKLGCYGDFSALASLPLDQSIPGGISGKVVYDTADSPPSVYYQNSKRFSLHYDFASKNLSGANSGATHTVHPQVLPRATFNATEYGGSTGGGRRFLLGAITYYEGPKTFVLEIDSYDTMPATDIASFFYSVRSSVYFGATLAFHPTSESVAAVAKALPKDIPVITNDDLFAKTDYQPLNLATTVGQVKFFTAAQLAVDDTLVGYRDIVVLDSAVNDIPPCAGMITQDFQTPLSHLNVLAANRGTPNMGLKSALTNAELLQFKGKWVEFTVGAQDWTMAGVTDEYAAQWGETHKPPPITLSQPNLTVTTMTDVQDLVVEDPAHPEALFDEISTAIKAYGSKGSNYGVMYNTGKDAAGNVISLGKDATGAYLHDPATAVYRVPVRDAFVIPLYWYHQFFTENGLYDQLDTMLANSSFVNDSSVRSPALMAFMDQIIAAPMSKAFSDALRAKLAAIGLTGKTVRFRSSTNAEDLNAFPCAGCYDSHTGDPADWDGDLLVAVKKAWASAWKPRTFDERVQHSIDHKLVAMGLLVHQNFDNASEYANGVTLTSNPYDTSGGLVPAFFINYQQGAYYDVVQPVAGITSDELIYYWYNLPDQPANYLAHSNIILPTQTVLNNSQLDRMGTALDVIHKRFSYAYGPNALPVNTGFYAIDDESKFLCTSDATERTFVPTNCDLANPANNHTVLVIKQARPNGGQGFQAGLGDDAD